MKFTALPVAGVHLIQQERREDERGFFARLWCERELRERGLDARVAQINTQVSRLAGTLRGMHFQTGAHAEVKIARCLRGAAFDVAIDLRPGSPTFRRWVGATLSGENGDMLYLPEGCAHGYLTLLPDTEMMYFASVPYAPAAATGVRFDDPAFAIDWPREVSVVSAADRAWPDFS
ncbi:MAG TPA: dTDP-4-dehydrorhamnose 3,5-epimerase family protein [Steroidobacteraceae bacterium]|nr:dTDP-4-dehydrorhamnose 3,5-epimerase family protein [Steroidobacteraceae bacterium]